MARDISFIVNDIKNATVQAAREASVQVLNSLAKAGPVWTGKFSSAWYVVPDGGTPGGHRSEGKIYTYDLRNVPKTRFKAGTLYQIVNGMEYAGQAMDMVPFDASGKLERKGPIDPERIKTKGGHGVRPEGGRRGEVLDGPKRNRSTAPLDWFPNYVGGGQLKKDLGVGARKGFGTYKPEGFG